MGVGHLLGHHVLRRPRPLPVPDRGLRPLRPRERPAAGHVPERHQVRGRDHRHDPRPPPRRGRHRRRAGRAGDHRRVGQHRPRHARLPGPRRPEPRDHPSQRDQARDRPSRLRQGVPPLRHRAAPGARRPQIDSGRRGLGRRPHRRRTPSPSSARPATTATAPSTRSRSSRIIAIRRGVGLHVDGCLGGFILPFGQELGYDIPVFDYRLAG